MLPVYLGTSEHIIILNSVEVTDSIALTGGWVRPDSTSNIDLDATLRLTQLPGAVVLGIVQGGLIDVQIYSKIGWGFISKTIRSQVIRFQVTESLESIVRRLLPN